jgi:hypothetical protein
MASDDNDSARDEPLATLTHARLRIAQGDFERARALLREIVERDGDLPGAEELLRRLRGRRGRNRSPESEERLAEPEPGDPGKLGEDFRRFFSESGTGSDAAIERLKEWLRRISGDDDESD